MRPRWWLLMLGLTMVAGGCVKRFPAAAGEDRSLRAGEEAAFGRPVERGDAPGIVWTMGDGTRLRGARVSHAWQTPGTYQVRVEVTDPDGGTRTDTARITVIRPPLLEVLPAGVGGMLWFDRPARRLGRVPLLLERLFVSGQEANATLSAIEKVLGFDPFSPEGLRAAGLDPQGGIAWTILDPAGRTNAVVAAVSDPEVATHTFERLFSRSAPVSTRQADAHPGITELLREDNTRPVAAMMLHRGFLWVAVPTGDQGAPADTLAGVRESPSPGLASAPGYRRARALRPQPGVAQLYLAKTFLSRSGQSGDGAAGVGQRVTEELDYLRADLDLEDAGLQVRAWLGLTGKDVPVVARTLRSRNTVPDFGAFIAPDQHLVIKVSADLAGLWRSILDLGGQEHLWTQMMQALEQMGAAAGVRARAGLLDNLGDNYLLAARIKPAGIYRMVASQGQDVPAPGELFDALVYAQVRDTDRLIETLGGLTGIPPLADRFQPVRGRDNQWRLAAGTEGLSLLVDHGFAVLATSQGLARDAIARMDTPRAPLPDWPAAMRSEAEQVAWADVGGLVRDLTQGPAPGSSGRDTFARAMLAMTIGKLASLRHVVLRAALEEGVFTLRLRLTLR